MYVIKRKSDGKFLSRGYNWRLAKEDRRWTDDWKKVRVFGRVEDAKQSCGWKREGHYTGKYPGPYTTYGNYVKEMKAYRESFVPNPEEQQPVELVKVFLIPETILV